eukprot:TRINITY_DN3548_c4_g1_i1.p1 TRINITY_DN3548_c4_g1~~TRINITY_DN3548_c4_g1_i1.p1  ORF type:complete len:362 (+),score=56.36 TRINITY_DN3548_c4_g1_i1:81-1088(+)
MAAAESGSGAVRSSDPLGAAHDWGYLSGLLREISGQREWFLRRAAESRAMVSVPEAPAPQGSPQGQPEAVPRRGHSLGRDLPEHCTTSPPRAPSSRGIALPITASADQLRSEAAEEALRLQLRRPPPPLPPPPQVCGPPVPLSAPPSLHSQPAVGSLHSQPPVASILAEDTERELAELQRCKEEAVAREDFDLAKKLKERITALVAPRLEQAQPGLDQDAPFSVGESPPSARGPECLSERFPSAADLSAPLLVAPIFADPGACIWRDQAEGEGGFIHCDSSATARPGQRAPPAAQLRSQLQGLIDFIDRPLTRGSLKEVRDIRDSASPPRQAPPG